VRRLFYGLVMPAAVGFSFSWSWSHDYGLWLIVTWDSLMAVLALISFIGYITPGRGSRGIPRKAAVLDPLPPHSHRRVTS
jgi:hypothetical protein